MFLITAMTKPMMAGQSLQVNVLQDGWRLGLLPLREKVGNARKRGRYDFRHDLKTPLPPFRHLLPQGEKGITPEIRAHVNLKRLPCIAGHTHSQKAAICAIVIA